MNSFAPPDKDPAYATIFHERSPFGILRFEKTAEWIDELGKKINVPLKSKGAVIIKITDIYGHAGAKVA
jgi:hypothetical protein